MCGIVFSIFSSLSAPDKEEELLGVLSGLYEQNTLRGPDSQSTETTVIQTSSTTSIRMTFFSSVLHLRGGEVVKQPHVLRDVDGQISHLLCWNGEVFEGLSVQPDENDGAKLFDALTMAPHERIVEVLSKIEGPYALVYYRRECGKVYFARDPLGRRSLLVHRPSPQQPLFLLTSVATKASWEYLSLEELPTENVYCLDILETLDHPDCISEISRHYTLQQDDVERQNWTVIEPLNRDLPPEDCDIPDRACLSPELSSAVDQFIAQLSASVKLRVQHIPMLQADKTGPEEKAERLAVLFSGGIDCTVLTRLAHEYLPLDEPIDLLNVAFENPRTLKAKHKGPLTRTKRTSRPEVDPPAAVESTPVGVTDVEASRDTTYDVPDRITGLEQAEELRKICPGRTFNFYEINVSYEECQRLRPTVEALMYPSRTVMDLSLALALYFASRGEGYIHGKSGTAGPLCRSRARVLLSGLGSDELLGGYSRHRNAYASAGWQGLIDELQLDLTRLPTRNLGRDDRVISSHGKETRYPFLSLSFVSFVARLPVEIKVDPRLGEGRGDKLLLRLAAARLGLELAAIRKKRAMQFGSRSARMEGGVSDRRGNIVLE